MISPDQRKLYWAELNGVLAARRDLTREEFHRLHNLPASTKEFTREHFDTCLAACRAITQPSDLKPQLRALNQPKARLLHKILVEQAAMLRALEKEDPTGTINAICADKFKGRKPAQLSADKRPSSFPSLPSVENSDSPSAYSASSVVETKPSELEMLMFTVARTISELRQERGWTQHDLNMAASLKCFCADCARVRRHINNQRERLKVGPAVPAGRFEPVEESNTPF